MLASDICWERALKVSRVMLNRWSWNGSSFVTLGRRFPIHWQAFIYLSTFILTTFLVSVAEISKLFTNTSSSYLANYSLIFSNLSVFSFCWTYLLSFATECFHASCMSLCAAWQKICSTVGNLMIVLEKWSWKKVYNMFHIMVLKDSFLCIIWKGTCPKGEP